MSSWLPLSGRSRSYPPAPDGRIIYAVGDIHGRDDLLTQIHRKIDQDVKASAGLTPVEIYIGDYIDRGSGSAQVLASLQQRSKAHELVLIKGNHELVLEAVLKGERTFEDMYAFGGAETLLSFGIPRRLILSRDESALRMALKEAFSAPYEQFFREMKPFHVLGSYLFVHAGIYPGVPLEKQSSEDLMWIREPFLSYAGGHGHIVIHGHTPVGAPDFRSNRINIDTGAFITNRLTCLRIGQDGASILA